jgi:hypothetical protein
MVLGAAITAVICSLMLIPAIEGHVMRPLFGYDVESGRVVVLAEASSGGGDQMMG